MGGSSQDPVADVLSTRYDQCGPWPLIALCAAAAKKKGKKQSSKSKPHPGARKADASDDDTTDKVQRVSIER